MTSFFGRVTNSLVVAIGVYRQLTLICTYRQLEKAEDYPEAAQKLIRQITRVKADRVLKQIL